MTMNSEARLAAIKEKDVSYHLGGTSLEKDWEWLIKQAEMLQQIREVAEELYVEEIDAVDFAEGVLYII